MTQSQNVTGKEAFFGDNEIIVSKTDLKGHITYANDVFLDIAGYTLLGSRPCHAVAQRDGGDHRLSFQPPRAEP